MSKKRFYFYFFFFKNIIIKQKKKTKNLKLLTLFYYLKTVSIILNFFIIDAFILYFLKKNTQNFLKNKSVFVYANTIKQNLIQYKRKKTFKIFLLKPFTSVYSYF